MSILLGLSIASFAYLNTLDGKFPASSQEIMVEEIDEEKSELLPDVQLIKMLMNKTLEFVTKTSPIRIQ